MFFFWFSSVSLFSLHQFMIKILVFIKFFYHHHLFFWKWLCILKKISSITLQFLFTIITNIFLKKMFCFVYDQSIIIGFCCCCCCCWKNMRPSSGFIYLFPDKIHRWWWWCKVCFTLKFLFHYWNLKMFLLLLLLLKFSFLFVVIIIDKRSLF